MLKEIATIVIITLPPIDTKQEKVFYLDDDYNECAIEYMLKNKEDNFFDTNNLLYKTIIKELEQKDLFK